MSTSADSPSSHPFHQATLPTEWQRFVVFWNWCLRREATRWQTHVLIVAPVVVLGVLGFFALSTAWTPQRGTKSLNGLLAFVGFSVLYGGALHGASAIRDEISNELRELVQLTGLSARSLLIAKTLARWWTIGVLLILLLPCYQFVLTLGNISGAHIAVFWWSLLLMIAVTASVSALAGLITVDTPNSSTASTLAFSMLLVLLLYHLVFWLSAAVLGNIVPPGPWRSLYDFAWQAAPVTVVVRAGWAPSLFSPGDPTYWIHFIVAMALFRFVTVVMAFRFRSLRTTADPQSGPVEVEEERQQVAVPPDRPRCTDQPFFWKDSYILGGGARAKQTWSHVYSLMAAAILLANMLRWDWELPLTLGIIAECVWPMLLAVRLDAMLAAEFREQTWTSLMLLPIDRRLIVWAKLRATVWEHQLALAPILLAVVFAFPHAPGAVLMVGVIAALVGVLMCQVSLINYLIPKYWWNGPAQILVFLSLFFFCAALWIALPAALSFLLTVFFLLVVIVPVHKMIEDHLLNWMES